jgi:hypothetical protein
MTITKLTGEMFKLRMNVNLISNVLGKAINFTGESTMCIH